MKIFPEFTWEFIIPQCGYVLGMFQDHREEPKNDLGIKFQTINLQRIQAIIDLVPKLRAHPEIEKFVPMLSMGMILRWFPSDGWAIGVEYSPNASRYSVSIMGSMNFRIAETKMVALDEVADQVYAYILMFQNGEFHRPDSEGYSP